MTTPDFHDQGYTVLPDFFDEARQIAPIREGIRQIIEAVAERHGVDAPVDTVENAMTKGIMALVAADRSYAAEVYDAVKQVPAFFRLIGDSACEEIFTRLRTGAKPGLAAGGYGIRMDLPAEEKFRAYWHQEFPAQLRSLDGIVFWSPLRPVTQDLGPVEICPGSHKDGLVPVVDDAGAVGRTGAYALRLENEAERIARYEQVAPVSKPGDLILMDFLTLHQSGRNVSSVPRWSMQWRYFNFNDDVGRKIGWKGSFAAGVDFASILPELRGQNK